MDYIYWLLAISASFALLERIRPARRVQHTLRQQLPNDLFYLVFNGHFYAVWFGGMIGWFALWTRDALGGLQLLPESSLLAGRPFLLQFLVFLVVSDFLQWNVHRLLHRVPRLWQFHKLHHSIHEMDWAGNFRFHWVEVIVYRSLLYVPLMLLLGPDGDAPMAVAVFATAWGHFNHSNLALGLGPLGWILNSGPMHLWHHDASEEGGVAKNFGIVFSLWDFLFGTVFWPRDRAPERLGYPGDGEMPRDLPRQLVFGLLAIFRRRT